MSTHSKGEDLDPKLRWLAIVLIIMAILSAAIGLRPHHWPPGSPIFEQASTRLYEILEMEEGHFPAEKIGSNRFLELSSVFVVAFFSLAAYVLIDKFLLNFRLWRTGFRTGRHVVVCGLGPIGLQIVTDYAKGDAGDEKLRVVAIEKEESCPGIGAARRLGAVVVTGDASDPFILKKTCARKARRVFAVTSSDVANLEIAAVLAKEMGGARKGGKRRMDCHVHLTDPGLAELFRLGPAFTGAKNGPHIHGFNTYERAASEVIRDMYAAPLPERNQVAHYFIFGFDAMGQTVAKELAMQAHFTNLKRFRLTVFDPAAESAAKPFLIRYPAFCPECRLDLGQAPGDIDRWDYFDPGIRPVADARAEGVGIGPGIEYVCNAEFISLPADIGGPALSHILAPRVRNSSIVPRFIICFEDERQSFSAAINLRNVLREFGTEFGPHQIFVWLQRESAFEQVLTKDDPGPVQIKGFGNPAKVFTWKHIVQNEYEQLAEFMHEQYLAKEPDATGPASKPWGELADEYRASSFRRACHMDVKLRVAGLERVADTDRKAAGVDGEKEPAKHMTETLAEMEHNRWNAERLMAGWRYGATRDNSLKIHPCLVPYADLPEKIKDYDRKAGPELFAFLKSIKQKVVKTAKTS